MVRVSSNSGSRFIAEEAGSSAAEFSLVVILLVTLLLGTIDFSRVLWQYNRMEKAAQLGARYAVTHNLVAPGLADISGVAAAGGNNLPVPISEISPNPVECTWSGGSASCNGVYGPEDDLAFTEIVTAMSHSYPQIRNDQVKILYGCVEFRPDVCLGFSGNPFGSDMVLTATVIVQGFEFDLLTPGLTKIASVTFGDISAAFTGESYGYPGL